MNIDIREAELLEAQASYALAKAQLIRKNQTSREIEEAEEEFLDEFDSDESEQEVTKEEMLHQVIHEMLHVLSSILDGKNK